MANCKQPSRHRLHALCPYFAMFPPEFVRENIEGYSQEGDLILDPFSGRGTTLLESLLLGRDAIAADVNPVAYCVSAAKADVPERNEISARLDELEWMYSRRFTNTRLQPALPDFFSHAFHPETLRQLISLRRTLNWREKRVDRFIAALVLGHLHGEKDRSEYYFSNQMPHSISTKPEYSVRYWQLRDMVAPYRRIFDILRNRAQFRLRMGRPDGKGHVELCDVRRVSQAFRKMRKTVHMVITSPPYLDITNFEEDQWLRLWFLGGPPHPTYGRISRDDRYSARASYWEFIASAWRGIAPLLKPSAILICRIGAKALAPDLLLKSFTESVIKVWPKSLPTSTPSISELGRSQMSVLHPDASGCGYEMDFAFQVN